MGNRRHGAWCPSVEGWQFDPDDPRGPSLGRKDGKYFLVRMQEMRDRNGRPYSQPVLVQEPQIAVQPGAPRVVGQILVARNRNGRLRAAWDRGLDGTEFHHLPMSSISNPDRVGTPARSRRTRYVCLDPKRIDGYVRVDLVEEDFPDAEGVTLADLAETSDGRTLAALAAVCL